MRERILNHLKDAGEPLPSDRVLLEVLRLHTPSGSAADRILGGIIGEDGRFGFSNGLWFVTEGDTASGWETGAVVLSIESADQERILRGSLYSSQSGLRWDFDTAAQTLDRQPSPEFLNRLVIAWSENELRLWKLVLHRCGITGWNQEFLAVRSLASRILSRPGTALNLGVLSTELHMAAPADCQPKAMVRFVADCLPLLIDRVPAETRADIRALKKWISEGKRAADFSQFDFGPDFVRQAPESPGVYVMRDRAGKAIYVGKSGNLRRRIRYYFSSRGLEDQKTARIHQQLYSLELRSVANEVEALLLEMRLIQKLDPVINLQTEVHRRRTTQHHSNILLIVPADQSRKVKLYFLSRGMFAGKQSLVLHRPPPPKLRNKIKALYFSTRSTNRSRSAWQVEIVARWFAQNRRRLNWIDVDEAGTLPKVMSRVNDYLHDPDELRQKVYYR